MQISHINRLHAGTMRFFSRTGIGREHIWTHERCTQVLSKAWRRKHAPYQTQTFWLDGHFWMLRNYAFSHKKASSYCSHVSPNALAACSCHTKTSIMRYCMCVVLFALSWYEIPVIYNKLFSRHLAFEVRNIWPLCFSPKRKLRRA